jgi:hypothetical protein
VRAWADDIWEETFGSAQLPDVTAKIQQSLFRDEDSDDRSETVAKPLRNGSPNGSETVTPTVSEPFDSKLNDPACLDRSVTVSKRLPKRTDPDQDQDQDPDPDPDARASAPYAREARLWDVQEGYRAQLGLPPLIAGDADLAHVMAGLEATGFSEAIAKVALGEHLSQCRKDNSKCRYFNGHTNWNPKNLRVAASMAKPPSNGGGSGGELRDLSKSARGFVPDTPEERRESQRILSAWGTTSGQEPTEDAS